VLLMHFVQLDLMSATPQLIPMHRTAVFFYGTFMSGRVLKEHGIECNLTLPAKLSGYRLSIRPRVNLHPQPDEAVYGGLAEVTHAELATLYEGLRTTFGINYHPFPVLAQLANGSFLPALCYLSFDIPDAPPDPAYVRALAECAEQLSAPESYIRHIFSFLDA
jgi:hypothetical protein